MKYTVIDCETDGLLDDVTLIHVLSYQIFEGKTLLSQGSITDPVKMEKFLVVQELIVCHSYIRYDGPVFKKILNLFEKYGVIDTLAASFYLYPIKGFRHGLGPWGERLGFGKPRVEDWKNQPIEVYINRCEGDVEINMRLIHHIMDYLMQIYDNDLDAVKRLLNYLNYKFYCIKDQEDEGITLDKKLAEDSKRELDLEIEKKLQSLSANMPRVVAKTAPKVMYKASGEISAHGLKWKEKLEELSLPEDSMVIYEAGNPGSTDQLKYWLIDLGWKPKTFKLSIGKYPKNPVQVEKLKEKLKHEKSIGLLDNYTISKEDGVSKEVAQISLPFGGGLCHSIKSMFEDYPYLEDLNGLYKARHRAGIFKAYLESVDESGKVYATAHGFTNTLRLQHTKPVVNLPGVNSYYGTEIRGCLTIPNDDYIMCGSDISGLEDNTKQHYIYFFDPQYVEDMRVPGFDPHIDIAVLAEMVTKEDETFFKWFNDQEDDYDFSEEERKRYKSIKKVRGNAKVVNFSATYGAGPPKIAKTLDCDIPFATKLHKTYWDRNAAVKKTAKACKVKTVGGQKWLYNPVSGFWMFLKAEKDRFSTLNQSTGVYVFDSWLRKCREKLLPMGIKIILQYHDELLFVCKKEVKQEVEIILKQAMVDTNKEINLNVEIGISVDWGQSYADCH